MSELEPLNEMPTSRLVDIMEKFDDEMCEPTVVNLDALLPKGRLGAQVLKTFLVKFKPSIRTLSLRFNQFTPEHIDELNTWLQTNESLRSLYLMGTTIDNNVRNKLEASWRKNLEKHSFDNLGLTFHRSSPDDPPPPGSDA